MIPASWLADAAPGLAAAEHAAEGAALDPQRVRPLHGDIGVVVLARVRIVNLPGISAKILAALFDANQSLVFFRGPYAERRRRRLNRRGHGGGLVRRRGGGYSRRRHIVADRRGGRRRGKRRWRGRGARRRRGRLWRGGGFLRGRITTRRDVVIVACAGGFAGLEAEIGSGQAGSRYLEAGQRVAISGRLDMDPVPVDLERNRIAGVGGRAGHQQGQENVAFLHESLLRAGW